MSSLPPDIITNILIRLPVKSLLRFRSVSKPWCSLIDGPQFIKLHLTHSITNGSNLSPITEYRGTLYSLDSDSLKNLVKIETPLINPTETNLSCTCNGLLLLEYRSDSESLILYHHSTRKHLVLPTPPPACKYDDFIPLMESNYLGYDVINNDYKVFNFLEMCDKAYKFITVDARIYSLKSNLWHIVKDITKGVIFDPDIVFETYVNGALHTVNDRDCTTIVALDVCKEAINLIPMPNIVDKNVSHFNLHDFDGRLAVLRMYSDYRIDIWVMKEYGVKESWSMFLSVKPETSDLLVIPMVYSKSCTEVLLSYGCQKLEWYDLKTKTVRAFEISGLPFGFGRVYVESLVSVGGTGKTDEKKKQHGDEK